MIKVEQSPYIIKELVKVADSFDQLHPAELSNAALILKATSDLLIEYPEQSVFKLDSLDTATSGSLLVGTAAIRTFSPDTLLCKSTGKLLVGYDDLIRVVDTNLMAEQETIKGGGRLNYIRPTQNGAIATFDMSIFILNPEEQVEFQYQNAGAEPFIDAVIFDSATIRIELENGKWIEVDRNSKNSRELK